MAITEREAAQIVEQITQTFEQVLNEYDFRKYPAANYDHFKTTFSKLNPTNSDIENAMVWKWGHWDKPNYPQHHKDLISEIQSHWPQFVASGSSATSRQTFEWWQKALQTHTRYITVAYITHLVHHAEPLPIIDQHNFRAMNALIKSVRPGTTSKKKPSSWNDIVTLKLFMSLVVAAMPDRSFSELDRFLMMYGSKLKKSQ
ncbi:MAG: hypothetical protein MUD01_19830 [Chloroflexaceae bacterium]|jgi:hypothetical protein|nr:hypothetical protein [Chloroflexaceae bacterium]